MLENARPRSERKRKHEQAELIHKASRKQRVRQLAHAILQQTRARLLFEFPYLLSYIPLYERRIPVKRFFQGSLRNILVHAVDSVRIFPLPGRPDLSEKRVRFLAH